MINLIRGIRLRALMRGMVLAISFSTSVLSASDISERSVRPGEVIGPWLMLGPVYDDVSANETGPTFQRTKRSPSAGEPGWATAVALQREFSEILEGEVPREGKRGRLRGQELEWRLQRDASPHTMWGAHFEGNHLTAALFSTTLVVDKKGPVRFRLITQITDMAFDALVGINGQLVCDTLAAKPQSSARAVVHEFTVELVQGANPIVICPYKISLGVHAGFRLEVVDSPVQVQVLLSTPAELRQAVEEEIASLELERDFLQPEHMLRIHRETSPGAKAILRLRLETMPKPFPRYNLEERGDVVREVVVRDERPVVDVCKGAELADGRYRLWCIWENDTGQPLTQVDYEIMKTTPTASRAGRQHMSERRRTVLATYAKHPANEDLRHEAWRQLALYELNQPQQMSPDTLAALCDFVDQGRDGADFVIQALLRMAAGELRVARLSPETVARIKATILGFRYWTDEPGGEQSVRNLISENHRLAWHVAEFLAGQLYPTETFRNSRQTGLFHALRARVLLTAWLSQRGRFGFDEWFADVYYPIDVGLLAHLREATRPEDYKFRQDIDAVLEYVSFSLAAGSLNGVSGLAASRTTTYDLRFPLLQQGSPLNWLLFGHGTLLNWEGSRSYAGLMGVVLTAASNFTPSEISTRIAEDRKSTVDMRYRQGNHPSGSLRQVNVRAHRTPDSMMASVQDAGKGGYNTQAAVARVTLPGDAVVFWSAPNTVGAGVGLRPDYWSGNYILPRVVQHRNVMVLTWRLDQYAISSHCFFEPARFDEVEFKGKWAFGRARDGYIGIYSENGYSRDLPGQYRGRELVCVARQNTWIAEAGRKEEWGSFEEFKQALLGARIESRDGAIHYTSPSLGEFVAGWSTPLLVGGKPVELARFPLVDGEWGFSAFGSGTLLIQHGELEQELYFP